MNMKVFPLVVLLSTCVNISVHGGATSDHQLHSKGYWRKQIAHVHRGMKRAAVEKILPMRSEPQESESVPDGRYSTYAVDSKWTVKVPYDFSGYVEDIKKNPHQLMHLYDNRVSGPIKLIHQHTEIDWTLFPPTL